jgi:hypothetical protein
MVFVWVTIEENGADKGGNKMKKIILMEEEREILINALEDALKLNNVDKNYIGTAEILLTALKKL